MKQEFDEFDTPTWRIVGMMIQWSVFLLGLFVFSAMGYCVGKLLR